MERNIQGTKWYRFIFIATLHNKASQDCIASYIINKSKQHLFLRVSFRFRDYVIKTSVAADMMESLGCDKRGNRYWVLSESGRTDKALP